MKRILWVSTFAVAWWAVTAPAQDSLLVPSLNVEKGATGVTIPIRIANDVDAVRSMCVPLVLREQTPGAFITSLTMSFGDRIFGSVLNQRTTYQYAAEDGTCKEGSHGGFGTITFGTPGPNPVDSSPEGIKISCMNLFGADLPLGSDGTGSLILTVDVTSVDGTFEIDTTCADPTCHLLMDGRSVGAIIPYFRKGIITIGTPSANDLPEANDDAYTGRQYSILLVAGPGVLANDTDADGDRLTAILDDDVDHGTLTLDPGGSFLYTPDPAYEGTDQFTYFAHDGTFRSLTPATSTILVKPGVPIAPGDFDEDGSYTVVDLGRLVDALFAGGPDPTDGTCGLHRRGDCNCDGFSTIEDLSLLLDHILAGGPAPCNPCED